MKKNLLSGGNALWVIALAVVFGVAYMSGMLGGLGFAPAAAVQAQPSEVTVIGGGQGGVCPDTGVSDLQTKITESIADSTGVKNLVSATVGFYRNGEVTPYTTIVTSTTGFTSTTSDPTCGEKLWAVVNASGYYTLKTEEFQVNSGANTQLEPFELDLIATIEVSGYNETNPGTKATTSMGSAVGTSETQTGTKLAIKANTARGVINKPAVCIDYDTANFSSVDIIGGTKIDVPSGICSGYEVAYSLPYDKVTDYDTVYFVPKIIAQSGINPSNWVNVTFRVIDLGTYTKAVNGVVFEGYQRDDTLADVGCTNQNFIITVS
jgi:hypothetical protein